MTTTSTPTTYSDLYTDAANRLRVNSSDATTLTILKRYINQGLHDLHIAQNWPWAERHGVIETHDTYTTGTVSIALAARTTVTGSGTLWATAVTGMGFNNARTSGKLTFSGASDVYAISTVDNDTQITLASRYIGDTALTSASYTYFEDEYPLASDFFRLVDTRQFTDSLRLPVISRSEFYTRFPRNILTGKPRVCTIIDKGFSGSTAPLYRVIFHPAPDAVMTLPYRYITSNLAVTSAGAGAANLVNDTDEPIIPLRYRHVLVFYAIAQWYRDRKDDPRSQEANAEYVDLVRRMSGDTSPDRDQPRLVVRRPLRAPNTRVGSRFGTGSWFDELRDRR